MKVRQLAAFTEMMNAVNAGDAKRYASLYAHDAVITIHGSGELAGRDAIEQHEAELLREFPGTQLAFYSMWQKGSSTVVHYAVNGRTRGGKSMGHEGLLFYRFDSSGLIAEERRYLDSLTPMAQLGVLGEVPARALPTLPTEIAAHVARGSPDEDENVEAVRTSFALLDAKQEAAFLAAVADDAVVDELVLPQPFIGKRNVQAWIQAWTRAVPDASFEITAILGVGEFVLVEGIVRGTLRAPFGHLAASNRPLVIHRAVILQMRNGTLARVSAFMNGKELVE